MRTSGKKGVYTVVRTVELHSNHSNTAMTVLMVASTVRNTTRCTEQGESRTSNANVSDNSDFSLIQIRLAHWSEAIAELYMCKHHTRVGSTVMRRKGQATLGSA